MTPGLFAPLQGLTRDEKDAGDVREFVGDGTPYLPVPGLTELRSVRIGRMDMPLYIAQKFPENGDFQQKIGQEWPLVILAEGTDGAVLLRSQQSNDGVWQPGMKVYVGGEWAAAPAPDLVATTESTPPTGNESDKDPANAGGAKK